MAARTRRTRPEIHQVRGVTYTPLDGRAHVDDTGLEVFEIIRMWLRVGEDWRRLTEAFHWLTADELNAALEFYRLNQAVVDARLDAERRSRVEDTWARRPESKPPYR